MNEINDEYHSVTGLDFRANLSLKAFIPKDAGVAKINDMTNRGWEPHLLIVESGDGTAHMLFRRPDNHTMPMKPSQ